jgi:hypothetical protein
MTNHCKRIRPIASIVVCIMAAFLCLPHPLMAAPQVSTDKDVYQPNEAIRVSFLDAPGNEGDWICIVPAGSPDDETGDFVRLSRALVQGVLVFNPPLPGKYQARAYFNYVKNEYNVSARYSFVVEDYPYSMMERRLNPSNPLESNVAAGHGLVYVFRDPWVKASGFDVALKANGTPVTMMSHNSYYAYSTPAGAAEFTTGEIYNTILRSVDNSVAVKSGRAMIQVKPGFAYYVRLRLTAEGNYWNSEIRHVPFQEAANFIEYFKMKQIK